MDTDTDIKPMSYLVKRQTTAPDSQGESFNYYPGAVLSDYELSDHIKREIQRGNHWYTQLYEPITDREARHYRVKATVLAGPRQAANGQVIDPPWDDYVGLPPFEIIERMKKLKFDDVERVRQYEGAAGGSNRNIIMNYVAPSEREPFQGYSEMGVRDILEKMSLFDDETNEEIILYEMHHQRRPPVLEYNREEYETHDDPDGSEEEEDKLLVVSGQQS